jgi:hypothetical protein
VTTFTFETFWQWLMRHPNCILRAGSPDAVLYDDEDLHWHFAADGQMLYVQTIRGKRLMGELAIDSERVGYVEWVGEEPDGEHVFELVTEMEEQRLASYFVVVSHPFEEEEPAPHERAVH